MDEGNRVVLEEVGLAGLGEGYYMVPWVVVWKQNDEFILFKKHEDEFSNEIKTQLRLKRDLSNLSSSVLKRSLIEPCKEKESVYNLDTQSCCKLEPRPQLNGPIEFEKFWQENINKLKGQNDLF